MILAIYYAAGQLTGSLLSAQPMQEGTLMGICWPVEVSTLGKAETLLEGSSANRSTVLFLWRMFLLVTVWQGAIGSGDTSEFLEVLPRKVA